MLKVAVLGAVLGAGSAQLTATQWSSKGTSFDLSGMTSSPASAGYTVTDIRDPTTSYTFDFFQAKPAPAVCKQNGTTDMGWQVDTVDPRTQQYACYRIGGAVAGGWNYSLYDPVRPARGVVLTYSGGDSSWCPFSSYPNRRNRTLSLQLLCSTNPLQSVPAGVSAIETNTCDYALQLPSIAGCPSECRTGGNVCNGNGVCGYNTDAGKSQCFCYTGYAGSSCSDPAKDSSGMSAEGVLLIITCIVLAGVLGLVAFMFLKLRRLQVDPAAYGELQGRFNELGMLA